MALFTISLREYINMIVSDDLPLNKKIDVAVPLIFDFKFPWYAVDNTGLDNFKRLFVLHFFEQEIGYETVELWKLKLQERLSILMPKYTELYKTTQLKYDPLLTDIISEYVKETGTKTDDGEVENMSTQNNSVTANQQNIHSDNPQVNFSGTDYASEMERGENVSNQTGKLNGTVKNSNLTSDERKINRNISSTHGNQNELIADFRKNILNLNYALIADCEDLFMGIFGDSVIVNADFSGGFFGTIPPFGRAGI